MPSLRSLALVAAFLAACSGGESDSAGEAGPTPPPLLVLAVDGFEWSVILPLVREGGMPHLAGLMERGTYGRLETMEPSKSPLLWTTMATGKAPSDHRILDFVKKRKKASDAPPQYTSADRRVKAFWNILSDHGVSSDTVGWWITYPVEEVHGMMVAQTNTVKGQGIMKGRLVEGMERQVWPPEREQQVFAALEENDRRLDARIDEIFGVGSSADESKRWSQCRWAFRADSTYVSVLRSRLEEDRPSAVTTIFLGGTDVVGHRFWPAHEPAAFLPPTDPEEVRAYRHVIPAYYHYVDSVLGELLGRLGGDARVLVVSDHGMRSPPPGSSWARLRHGYHDADTPGAFLAAGPGIRACSPVPAAEVELEHIETLGHIADVCPTLLALVDVPHGEDMLGRPLEVLFTAAYLDRHPIRSVASHDDDAWLAARRRERERERGRVHEDAERLEQLRELGYLGED